MENMVSLETLKPYFQGKKVFLTGHTGFKGAWLLMVLHRLGAQVKGFSLEPEHAYDLYPRIDGESLCSSSILHDLRDSDRLIRELLIFEPDYVFHLAAQPLVMRGYTDPLYTFQVNTEGTATVLEAIRLLEKPCVAVMITTDKVYENNDGGTIFTEDDRLGGHDPYSASKAACELIIASYRKSFFTGKEQATKALASVRAGNVIGGGDFADNRIIPDIIRAVMQEQTVTLRHPNAIRPWQHVLEPVSAYLQLAARLSEDPQRFSTAYNIGPDATSPMTVEALTQHIINRVGKGQYQIDALSEKVHEAATLQLSTQKIETELGWKPQLTTPEAINWTVDWYMDTRPEIQRCHDQIDLFFKSN
ncbi:MAG: CDP-glucose 4,6-dehydratase [Chitinophagaceae bacterium]